MPEPPDDKQITREQRRAQAAYEAVKLMEQAPGAADYGRLCLKLPVLIQQSGLCQTLAFLEAKSKKAHFQQVLENIESVTGINRAQVRTASVLDYQRMSREAVG